MSWKKKLKLVCVAGLIAATSAFIAGCGSSQSDAGKGEKKLQVVATIFPVYDVAKQVGGDKVDVKLLVPPGAEPHDWEPTTADLKEIGKAQVFLYNGAGMEPTEKLLSKEVLGQAKPYELSKGIELLPGHDEDEDHDHDKDHDKDHDHDKNKEEDKHGHSHDGEEYNPHVWLNPMNVVQEVHMVVQAFSEADPANADYYKKNGEAYIEKLKKLDAEYKEFAASNPNKELVVSHEAYGYLCKQYGWSELGIMGINPDSEPTPAQMAEIVEFVKTHHVKAIFSEELLNPKLAEAIAKESGAKVYELNPAESPSKEDMEKGVSYISIMQDNLQTLKEALK